MANDEFFRNVMIESEKCQPLALAALAHPDCPLWFAEEIVNEHNQWEAYEVALAFEGISREIILREAGTSSCANEVLAHIADLEVMQTIINGQANIDKFAASKILQNEKFIELGRADLNLFVEKIASLIADAEIAPGQILVITSHPNISESAFLLAVKHYKANWLDIMRSFNGKLTRGIVAEMIKHLPYLPGDIRHGAFHMLLKNNFPEG
jgi:hypothetical protein